MPISFADLEKTGRYSFGSFRGTTVIAHEDDRWILPVVAAARTDGEVKTPALLISLDRHHDACDLRKGVGRLANIRRDELPAQALLDAVESDLAGQDDDWIKAGMELGLFGDAVVWGVDQNVPGLPDDDPYTDHLGTKHNIFINSELPGGQLEFQGDLSDLARRGQLQPYWDALGWNVAASRWAFRDEMRCVLNIDLDCFVVRWEEFTWAWPDEVWEARFQKPSTYAATKAMTSASVLREVLDHTSLITIAREPNFTGGRDNGRKIDEQLRHYLFADELDLPSYPA